MEDYVSANPNWIPAGRVGQPEDVAKAIVFLADKYELLALFLFEKTDFQLSIGLYSWSDPASLRRSLSVYGNRHQ